VVCLSLDATGADAQAIFGASGLAVPRHRDELPRALRSVLG
jgi:hypothetical protein